MSIYSAASLREAFDRQYLIQTESERRAIYRMIFAMAIALGIFWAWGEYSIARQINEDWHRGWFEHQLGYNSAEAAHAAYLVHYGLFAAGILVAIAGVLGFARVPVSRWLLLLGAVAVAVLKAMDFISVAHLRLPAAWDLKHLPRYLMILLWPISRFLIGILFSIVASIALILTPWPRKTAIG